MGEIKSLGRVNIYGRLLAPRILRSRNLKEYRSVTLYFRDGSRSQRLVHRIVGVAFLENPFNKPYVNHLNGKKWDNRKVNIAWSTQKENMVHASEMGLLADQQGSNNSNCKLTAVDAIAIKNSVLRSDDLAARYNISVGHVKDIRGGRKWKCAEEEAAIVKE
jgi:hypothetical protein